MVLGDKCSVKRSVIGSHCRIASGVKVGNFWGFSGLLGLFLSLEICLSERIYPLLEQITNSLLMDEMVVGEGCVISNSILGHGVVLQDHVSLKDCHVGEIRGLIFSVSVHFIGFWPDFPPLQVGSDFVLGSGKEYKGELLSKNI